MSFYVRNHLCGLLYTHTRSDHQENSGAWICDSGGKKNPVCSCTPGMITILFSLSLGPGVLVVIKLFRWRKTGSEIFSDRARSSWSHLLLLASPCHSSDTTSLTELQPWLLQRKPLLAPLLRCQFIAYRWHKLFQSIWYAGVCGGRGDLWWKRQPFPSPWLYLLGHLYTVYPFIHAGTC